MSDTRTPRTKHTPLTIALGGWTLDPQKMQMPARVFGELLTMAIPTVQNYHSDLYHDAMWLHDNLTTDETLTFTYITRENGTWLSNDPKWSKATVELALTKRDSRIFSAAVFQINGMWYLALSEMTKEN